MEPKVCFEWFTCFSLRAADSFLEVSDQCDNVCHTSKAGGPLTAASVRRPTCSASANTLGLALCCRGSNFFPHHLCGVFFFKRHSLLTSLHSTPLHFTSLHFTSPHAPQGGRRLPRRTGAEYTVFYQRNCTSRSAGRPQDSPSHSRRIYGVL